MHFFYLRVHHPQSDRTKELEFTTEWPVWLLEKYTGRMSKLDTAAKGAAAELPVSSCDTTDVLDGVNGEEWQRPT